MPNGLNPAVHTIYQVPADDYSNWRYDFEIFFDHPVDDIEAYALAQREEVEGPSFKKKMNRDNDYLIDRARQRSGEAYCGIITGNHTQDAMVTENTGPCTGPGSITDRTKEHLGATDLHITQMRNFLLRALRDMREGLDPPGVAFKLEDNKIHDGARMITATLPKDKNWKDLLPVS